MSNDTTVKVVGRDSVSAVVAYSDLQASLVASLEPRHLATGLREGDRVRIVLGEVTGYGTIQPWYPASVTQDQKVELDGTGQSVIVPGSILSKV